MTQDPADRRQSYTEYVVEPTDAHGDIIDPSFFPGGVAGMTAALESVPSEFASYSDAEFVDFARRVSTAYAINDSGKVSTYYYLRRFYRDGSSVELDGGETPKVKA